MISILGYLIVPDKSPNCNEQSLSIAAKKPFFTVKIALIPKNKIIQNKGWFHTMLFGREYPFQAIPIDSFHFSGDNVQLFEYTERILQETFLTTYPLVQSVYALNTYRPVSLNKDSLYHFTTADGKQYQFHASAR